MRGRSGGPVSGLATHIELGHGLEFQPLRRLGSASGVERVNREASREASQLGKGSPNTFQQQQARRTESDYQTQLAVAVAQSAQKMLPNRIIMVRHGESEGNCDETLYRTKPDNLVELTQKGWDQAAQAGERIRTIIGSKQVHMYTSPFTRTIQTAQAIKRKFPHQVARMNIDPRIREQEFGNIQGDEFRTLREEQQKVGRFYYRFPTGESGADVWDRTKQWWDALMSINLTMPEPVDTVVVVTHGLTMRLILMQMYGWSPNTFHTIWNASNCNIYVLDRDRDTMPGGAYRTPYRLNNILGDVPVSSIWVMVAITGEEEPRELTLHNYLSLPQPRLNQFPIAAMMLAEEYSLDVKAIESIKCCKTFHGEFHISPATVPLRDRQRSSNPHVAVPLKLSRHIAEGSAIDGDGEHTIHHKSLFKGVLAELQTPIPGYAAPSLHGAGK